MVRLVFRPYTQLRRSICTSESLRTSTRVSPGFVLARHRSPSFGSQRVRSGFVRPTRPNPFKGERSREHSDALGLRPLCSRRDHPSRMHPHRGRFTFIAPREFSLIISRRLAHMLDSLVRVSRRVGWDPTSTLRSGPPQVEHRNFFSVTKKSYDTSREETGHDRAVLLGNAALVITAPAKVTTKLANGRPV